MAKKIVLWFAGLSQSGKTTNSNALQARLESLDISCATIDGDTFRGKSHCNLGYTKEDRFKNTKRAAHLAVQHAQNVALVLCSFISPYREQRRIARDCIVAAGLLFIEIYCKCPLEYCEARDTKGYYKKARNGEITNFTGISDPYEEPEHPDIILLTESATVEENTDKIIDFLKSKSRLL